MFRTLTSNCLIKTKVLERLIKYSYGSKQKVRLDNYLTSNLKSSRAQVIKLIERGLCTVNKENKKPSYKLNFDDKIEIRIPEIKNFELKAEEISLKIIFEDDDLIVIDKDFGMVVHPSHGHSSGTLVNALLYHCEKLSMGFHEHRPGIVHRLDKDTGGLIVAAKTQTAMTKLAEQFKEKSAGRVYNAICFGKPKLHGGLIQTYLSRDPKNRKKFASTNNPKTGKVARTHFKVLVASQISVIELKLDTGRTHQIRVHLSELGCPIVNDAIYGSARRLNSITDSGLKSIIKKNSNMLLYARELSFRHPVTDKVMSFKVELPNCFNDLIDYLSVPV